jgi:radical SAM protein with 4Fe4S-binding SPASM domain
MNRIGLLADAFGEGLSCCASAETLGSLRTKRPSFAASPLNSADVDWVWLFGVENFLCSPNLLEFEKYLGRKERGVYSLTPPKSYTSGWDSSFSTGCFIDSQTFRELYEGKSIGALPPSTGIFLDSGDMKKLQMRFYEISPGPYFTFLENTSYCNLKCVMCPFHSEELKSSSPVFVKNGSAMPMELFEKAVVEMGAFKGSHPVADPWIISSVRGEVFFDKDYLSKIKLALKHGLKFNVFTNGALLDEKALFNLLEIQVDQITVSLDSMSDATGKAIRVGSSPSKIIAMLDRLVEAKRRRGLKNPNLVVTFTDTGDNSSERELFLKYWEGKASRLYIHHSYEFKGKSAVFKRKYEGFENVPRDICSSLLSSEVVFSDGQIHPCCLSGDYSETLLGNLKTDSISSAFRSERKRKLVQAHFDGDFAGYETCRNCEIWMYSRAWQSHCPGRYWDTVQQGPLDCAYIHTGAEKPRSSWFEAFKRMLAFRKA